MTPRLRLLLFLAAIAFAGLAAAHVIARLPAFGTHPIPYGAAINAVATRERHVTNMVSAVNFDYRGLDTLGEEFMLLCAVTGVTVLLRGPRGEQTGARPGRLPDRPILPRSDAIVLICRPFGLALLLFGAYVALHAMTTPGGGFQGGAIAATAALLVFVGESYRSWRRLVRSETMDGLEGAGALLYALCGFAGLLAGHPFGANILPFGNAGDLFSGGLMVIENAGIAVAVAGGFAVLFIEFLEETRAYAGPPG